MRGQRGFTLLEVVVATSIMSIGIVSALELFTGSLRLAGEADRQSSATVLARSLVDEELWRAYLEENERSGSDGDFSYRVATYPIERELVGFDEVDDGLHDLTGEFGLWLIEVEVSWETPRGPKSLVLETARIGELPN